MLNYIKTILPPLPKNVFGIVIGVIVTITIAIIFFVVRDVFHLFGLAKDKITK